MPNEQDSSKDGGQAFPVPDSRFHDGMTLRDYFTGQFLTSVVVEEGGASAQQVARNCYLMADAMIAERAK